jgi:pSer/pThr/pTyr-binding forkhead associated (FHA) protein
MLKKPEAGPGGTMIDMRRPSFRLKEGITSADTGVFLRIEEGADAGQSFTLSQGGVYLIGREDADIKLADDAVSRKHAEIAVYGPGAHVLRDLASTNGTFLNGKRVPEKRSLEHWDLIRVGDTALRFEIVTDSIPLSG